MPGWRKIENFTQKWWDESPIPFGSPHRPSRVLCPSAKFPPERHDHVILRSNGCVAPRLWVQSSHFMEHFFAGGRKRPAKELEAAEATSGESAELAFKRHGQ